MNTRRIKGILFAFRLFVFAVFPLILFNGTTVAQTPEFPHSSLAIESADGKTHAFDIEVATTEEQLSYGLMNRHSLSRDSGMLFVFHPAREVSFWMKNTFIPLDLLFVRGDGAIVRIVEKAKPLDLSPLPSGEPVVGVIEINGGEAGRRNIKTGDKVRSESLKIK